MPELTLDTIISALESSGCTLPNIDLLYSADPFLDTTGEDLRRRIFITQENSGKLLCLRPEFTIPVCLQHLEKGWLKARYAYGGKVFRQRADDTVEFTQAGFENLGSVDADGADIDCILTAISTIKATGENELSLVLGDKAIFASALDALQIPNAWKNKLIRNFGDKAFIASNIEAMSLEHDDGFDTLPPDVQNAINSGELSELVPVLRSHMNASGLPLSGGRTPEAIGERLLQKAGLAAEKLDQERKVALEDFLKINVPLSQAVAAIEKFENDHGVVLTFAKEVLDAKKEGLSEAGIEMRYVSAFGRRLDYYTGFVFEIYAQNQIKPLVGGGRYDQLLTLLGSPEEIPAVGFSIWVDRLEARK